jgi:hypothetical protein
MTDDKVRAVLDRYEREVVDRYDYPSSSGVPPAIAHALTMIPKMRNMLADVATLGDEPLSIAVASGYIQKREKLMRWLGFLQGVLFAFGIYTVDEMRAHNKPDAAPPADGTTS